jgi:hypothetical protein
MESTEENSDLNITNTFNFGAGESNVTKENDYNVNLNVGDNITCIQPKYVQKNVIHVSLLEKVATVIGNFAIKITPPIALSIVQKVLNRNFGILFKRTLFFIILFLTISSVTYKSPNPDFTEPIEKAIVNQAKKDCVFRKEDFAVAINFIKAAEELAKDDFDRHKVVDYLTSFASENDITCEEIFKILPSVVKSAISTLKKEFSKWFEPLDLYGS